MNVETLNVAQSLERLSRQPWREFPQPREKLEAEAKRGVYVIADPAGKIVHIGSTPRARRGIEQRLKNHLAGKSSFVRRHLGGKGHRLRKGYKYQFLVVENSRHRALLEALAIGVLCPEHLGA